MRRERGERRERERGGGERGEREERGREVRRGERRERGRHYVTIWVTTMFGVSSA